MKKCILFFYCISLILTTGCWDRKDIETRGYVIGIAIDSYPPAQESGEDGQDKASQEEKTKFEQFQLHTGEPMYSMTVQIPIIKKSALIPQGQGGGGGSAGGEETSRSWQITQVGNSFMEMNREIATRTNFSPYYGHLQAVVVSEDVARNGISNILDFFISDPEMRIRTKIFISKGDAKKILEVVPKVEDFSALYLSRIPINALLNSRIIHKTDLGELAESLRGGQDFVLPQLEAVKDEIKSSTAAVFKGDKMVGWVEPIELEAVKLLRGLYKGGVLTAPGQGGNNSMDVVEVSKAETKITPIIKNEEISFKVKIAIEGNIVEKLNQGFFQQIDKEYIKAVENALEAQVKQMCDQTVKRIQEEYSADIFQFNVKIKSNKPEVWEEVKDNWDEIFEKLKVEIDADVKIRHSGITR